MTNELQEQLDEAGDQARRNQGVRLEALALELVIAETARAAAAELTEATS